MANLKKLFPEFYQPVLNEKDLSGRSDNIIILDTNYLLEVIKSPTIVSKQYVEAIEKVKSNIYIPYLVALEFNFNKSKRKKLKMQEINNYKKSISDQIESIKEKINDINFVNNDNKEKFTEDITKSTEVYSEDIQNIVDNKIKSIVTNEQEELYDRLIRVIENKIGESYEQDWISDIEKEGETRFENKIPPGFGDENKDDKDDTIRRYNGISYQRKYGDLIIWKDIIDFSKKCGKKGKKVIFVTNDGTSKKKNDLLYKVNNLTIGPSIYLMNELQKEAQKEFYILNNLRFIQLVNNLSDEQVNELKTTINNQHKNNFNSAMRKKIRLMIINSDIPLEIKQELAYKLTTPLSEVELLNLYEIISELESNSEKSTNFTKKIKSYYFDNDDLSLDNDDLPIDNTLRDETLRFQELQRKRDWRKRRRNNLEEELLHNKRIQEEYFKRDDDDTPFIDLD